jgi:starvation-inducible outer membrane lipoprotein
VATGLIAGCGLSARNTIPSEFILQAEPGVTLTALTTHPELYQGKVVIVGGVPLAEIREGDRVWIELRNRPLEGQLRASSASLSRRTRGRTLLGASPIPRLPSDLAHVGASARPSPFSTATGHG